MSLAKRRQLAALLEAAFARAQALEINLDPATHDQIVFLFQSRLPLINNHEALKTGQNAARALIERAVSNARYA